MTNFVTSNCQLMSLSNLKIEMIKPVLIKNMSIPSNINMLRVKAARSLDCPCLAQNVHILVLLERR
jgi:hypothetical protein